MFIDNKRLYTLCVMLFALLLIALFIPFYSKIALACLLAVSALTIFVWVKKRSILSLFKKEVALILSVLALVFVLIYYLTGLKFGFTSSVKPLTWTSFFKDLLPTLVMIVAIEIIRYVFLAQKKRLINLLTYFSCIAVDVLIYSNVPFIQTFNGFMAVVGLNLLPAFLNNVTYHYVCKSYGFLPNILFKAVFALYPFILPVTPLMPEALLAVCRLLVPLITLGFIRTLYDTKRRFARVKHKALSYVSMTLVIALLVSIAMLISCQFRWCAIVVGSESMTGAFDKGDAVIYERYDDQVVEIGQVVVFEKDGVTTIHRVVDIKNINGVLMYFTKGDKNDHLDDGFITNSNLLGLVHLRVRYVGFPTIWLRQLFG